MLDSYEALIPEYISKEEFFRFGLEKTIYIPDSKVKQEWKNLKDRIKNNNTVYMRGVKDSIGNQLFFDFYKHIFKNENVKKDPSNTQNPTKVIEALSGYKKSKDLRNYQLTSIFGRNKNILAFCAPWNLAYTPNIVDPLMGVDAKGAMASEYQKLFLEHSYKKFKPYIDEYNEMVSNTNFVRTTDEYFEKLYDNSMLDKSAVIKFEEVLRDDFSAIVT